MKRSKRSSEPSPLEFFVDRCLGKECPAELAKRGWRIHLVADHYPDDGQHVSDPEWISHGIEQGWTLLTQDGAIRRQIKVLQAVEAAGLTIHSLDSAQLRVAEKVERFHGFRAKIERFARKGPAGFYVVHRDEIVRAWP